MTESTTRRGATNGNARGSAADRRSRRKWLIEHYASETPGLCRCYRCGKHLYNPDDHDGKSIPILVMTMPQPDFPYSGAAWALPLTVDRIIPGCQGGTYRRNNIRPACGLCNSETGGRLATRRKS